MQLNLSRQWYEREFSKDAAGPTAAVTAGQPNLEMPKREAQPASTAVHRGGAALAFGLLVQMTRRSLGWTIEKLAEQADVDLETLIQIEHEEGDCPDPHTVYNLAAALHLPEQKLLALSGAAHLEDQRVREAALRFAARSKPVEQLNATEREALEEFVKFLNA